MCPIPRYIQIPVALDRDMEVSNISFSGQESKDHRRRMPKIPSRWETSDHEDISYGIPHLPTRCMSDFSRPQIPVLEDDDEEDEEGLNEDLGHDRWCAIPKAKKTPRAFSHVRSDIVLAHEDDENSPRGVEEYTDGNSHHIQRRMTRIGRRWRAAPAPCVTMSDGKSAMPEDCSVVGSVDALSVSHRCRQSTPAA